MNMSGASDGAAGSGLEERLRPLLLVMLARLRRDRDTPLRDGIDSAAIIQEALRTCSAVPLAVPGCPMPDLQLSEAILDGVIERALRDEQRPGPERPVSSDGRLDRAVAKGADLATWLGHLHAALRATHPTAVEMVVLRVEGCEDREIAQRLGLGLRLVRRVIRDLRRAWEQSVREGSTDAGVSDLALRGR